MPCDASTNFILCTLFEHDYIVDLPALFCTLLSLNVLIYYIIFSQFSYHVIATHSTLALANPRIARQPTVSAQYHDLPTTSLHTTASSYIPLTSLPLPVVADSAVIKWLSEMRTHPPIVHLPFTIHGLSQQMHYFNAKRRIKKHSYK